jgi:LuxR family transcriptional regulator, maltose regulon positive regulatory protein
MVELLRTKLFIPRPRKNLVSRPRLVDRLNAGLDNKLTLIAAPAGFGKTTILSEWIQKSPCCVTWLSLDEGDNDPAQFWAYFIASLQGLHPDLGSKAFALIQSPQAPPIRSILTELINDLTAFSDPFASVLDDYHFIDSQPIHEALSFLIDHLPANAHLVITTREDPPLPLARLRARDQLTEIRARDLRFTGEETDEFLRDVMRLELSRQDVAALENRTEGWVAGLQLAGLSMQKQADLKGFIAEFSGSHRHILDYLTDEVLQKQPEGIRTFLIQTSILDRLSGPLCDALTGRSDSDRLLAHLEAANLFVIPLDEERRWYRYHHLFADLLRNQLERTQSELISELHQRASQWFEGNEDIQAAVEHALQASDLTRAARLIEQYALLKLYRGEIPLVVGWFDRLPGEILDTAPMLCICKAWALVLMQRGSRREEGVQALHVAEQALDRVNAGEALRDLVAGHAASIRAFLLPTPQQRNKEPEKIIALSQEAQRLLPVDEKAIRSLIDLCIGYAYLALADVETARQAYQMALEDGLNGGNYYMAIYGLVNQVLCALLVGNLGEALQLCDTNIKRFNELFAGQYFSPIGALYVLKGSILLETDHLDEAEQLLTEGLDLIRWTGESIAHRKGYAALARLRAIQGDRPAMLEAMKALEEIWPEFAIIAQALRQRLLLRYFPDDLDMQKNARTWLLQSEIKFFELVAIESYDPTSITYLESYLNTAYVLTRLARGKPGAYPVEDVHAYLIRQQDFAATHGFIHYVVAAAIARTLLYQAEGKKNKALESLEFALNAAAPTGLWRIFVDECEPLQALLEELKPRLTDGALTAYANRLLEAMRCETAKPDTGDQHAVLLSERELEVLRHLATGQTYEEISQQLFLSLNTIQYHVKNIYSKLKVNKRVQAIEKAQEMKLI